jgi:hypothetical protein
VANANLDWKTPFQLLTGETTDISILLNFVFWEDVYYSRTSTSFPSDTTEELGNFVGFAEHVGDAKTLRFILENLIKSFIDPMPGQQI